MTHRADMSKEIPPEEMDICSDAPPCQKASIANSDVTQSEKISPKLPKTRKELRRKIHFLRIIGSTRKQQLSPKARKLYTVACRLKKTIETEKQSYKRRLKEAVEYAQSEEFLRKHLTVNSANFVMSQLKHNKTSTCLFSMSQLKHRKKTSRGCRYDLVEKIYALSLLKLSPKAYSALKQTFALPSRRTLTGLLNKVPFNCGINHAIMKCFKSSVSKMDVMDRYCTLVFDEMSIEPGLHYDQKSDKIDDFVNCGDGMRKALADHAMVFMARGSVFSGTYRQNLRLQRERRAQRERQNQFLLPDNIFTVLFRLYKCLVTELIELLTEHLYNRRNIRGLSIEQIVFCVLKILRYGLLSKMYWRRISNR